LIKQNFLNEIKLDNIECRNSHVIFLTGKNIKLSHFMQHDKNKSQPHLIHIHREYTIAVKTLRDKIFCNSLLAYFASLKRLLSIQ
jgi:hypothetical protein